MKKILIDRTELMGKIIWIESNYFDMRSRSVIARIKDTILSMPTIEIVYDEEGE